ncbi:MAG: alpha/beta hydrolase [Planctomycetota bacterium]|nr:alpha/beta hydrolase [Planctomycetota bacterium]
MTAHPPLPPIFSETEGDSGSPVLLIMGLGSPGSAWRHQIPDLAHHHQVAWFDHRGLGQSPLPETLQTTEDMAKDALSVLDSKQWGSAHVVGVSMGGMVAQSLALMATDRIRSLTLIATHPGGLQFTIPPLPGLYYLLRSGMTSGTRRLQILSRLLFPAPFRTQRDTQWILDVLEKDFGTIPSRFTQHSQIHAIKKHQTQKRLHNLAGIPTLVVRPGSDLMIRAKGSDFLAQNIPGAQLLRIEEAGHGIVRQCPEILNPALLEHFKRSDQQQADTPAYERAQT